MIMSIKQQIINKNGNIKQINIKNPTNQFFNDIINIEDFDSSLRKIGKKSSKNFGICNIGYITIKKVDDYENIHSVNPLYLMDISKKKIGSKYLVFNSIDEERKY